MLTLVGTEKSEADEPKKAVLIEHESALEVRENCERVRGEGGYTVVKVPEILSPVLARLCDVALLSGERLEKITGISPSGEAYLCLALKKLYGLGVSRAVVFLEEETVFADGQTVRYEKAAGECAAIEKCVDRLINGRNIAEE